MQPIAAAERELDRSNIHDALRLLSQCAAKLENVRIQSEIKDIETRYYYMLRFVMSNPKSNIAKETDSVKALLRDVISDLRHAAEARRDTLYGSQLRFQEMRPEENLQSIISDYLAEAERLHSDVTAFTNPRAKAQLERLANDIFNRIWTLYRPDEDIMTLINDLIADNTIPALHRELWVNALGLAASHISDRKISAALRSAAESSNRRIRTAASVWLVIAAANSEAVVSELEGLNVFDIVKALSLNLADNDNDFFAEMASLSQRFKGIDPSDPEALKNVNLTGDDYDRLKRFNEAQAGGADVFGKSIGRMRQFPFFAAMPNWFLPFDTQHSALAEITDGEGAEIAESIAMMPNIADSDKYAMLLSMGQLPQSMRNQALTSMVDSMRSVADTPEYRDAMNELSNVSDNMLIANQVHALVRFINSFPKVKEFPVSDILKAESFVAVSPITQTLTDSDKADLARVALKLNLKSHALRLIESISDTEAISDNTLELKADLLIECEGDKNIAADIYDMLFTKYPDRNDIAHKLARLYNDRGEHAKAIALLESLADQADLGLLAEAYLDAGNLEEAALTLHRLDYNLPTDDYSAKKQLAFIYLISGSIDEAASTIDLIPARERNSQHPFLAAMIMWLDGNAEAAVALLRSQAGTFDSELELYEKLQANISALAAYPVGSTDTFAGLTTMPDILRYKNDNNF